MAGGWQMQSRQNTELSEKYFGVVLEVKDLGASAAFRSCAGISAQHSGKY